MKRIIFLIIASLLVVGLVLSGCNGDGDGNGEPPAFDEYIKFAIVGPTDYIQGEHMMWGAEVARDEINDAGGIDVNGDAYGVELIEVDSDEIDNPAEAGDKVRHAITVLGADFVIGGFRTEAVWDMVEAAVESEKIMFIQSAATTALIEDTVVADYDTYKYIFRSGVPNDNFLMNNNVGMLAMVGSVVEAELVAREATVTTPRVAIFAEELSWADTPVNLFQLLVIPSLGWTHTYTARVPDDASAEVVATHLAAIEEAETHIIFTMMSGPVGLTYGTQMGVLGVPAMTVGINVEAQDPGYWTNTNGGGAYHITLGFLAPNVSQTALTEPFATAFAAHTGGEYPIYTAASYDTLLGLEAAIEGVGSFTDTDALIEWFEDPANARTVTIGVAEYYAEGLESPYNRHDLVYACDRVTGIGVQWLDEDIAGVWPKAEYGGLLDALALFGPTCWTGFEFDGTEHFEIPDDWVTEWEGYLG
jgi:branched-chain amino acid transport system substrate-binding protein